MIKSTVTAQSQKRDGSAIKGNRGRSGLAIKDGEMRELIELIYRHSGIVLTPEKKSLVISRLHKRLKALDIGGFDDYLDYLKTSPERDDEIVAMINEITTNKTAFFRENHHFDFLTSQILPSLSLSQWSVLNVWSAGCSTGEEPYSLAMVLANYFGGTRNFRILATDLSTRVLQTAYRAVYPNESAEPIPPALRKKYTMSGIGSQKGYFRIVPELRECVTFQQDNLIRRDWGAIGMMDIIFCRNVMIYFDQETRSKIVSGFSRKLKPGGYLFIGHSETLGGLEHSFTQVHPTIYSYQK